MAVKKPIKKETDKKVCNNCKRNLAVKQNFYNTNSPLSKDGKLDICKKCLQEMIDINDMSTIYKVLQLMDIPFYYDYWEKAKENRPDNPWGAYIRMANSGLNEFKNSTYTNSVFEPKTVIENDNISQKKEKSRNKENRFKIEDMSYQDLEDKWGYGYSEEEYYCFEKKWRKLIDNYGEKTSLHREALITYIRFRVKEELATARGDIKESKEWGSLASKAQTDGKLNVSQLSKSDISGGVDLVCQIFEAVESEVGVLPLLPKLVEQPMDDADMVIWAIINYGRILDDKPQVQYKDIWNFYNDMLKEHFEQQGFNEEQTNEFLRKRNNVFRDLSRVYVEPLYEDNFEAEYSEEGDD